MRSVTQTLQGVGEISAESFGDRGRRSQRTAKSGAHAAPTPADDSLGGMAKPTRGSCARCEREVEVAYEYSATTRRWLKLYLYVPGVLLLPMLPFLAGDFAVSLPLMMAYMLGLGPALSIIRAPPLCAECGALMPKPA